MPAELVSGALAGLSSVAPVSALPGFLLVLARIGGVFAFLPIPGMRTAPALPKIVLTLALSLVLAPGWGAGSQAWHAPPEAAGAYLGGAAGGYLESLASEAAFGLVAGVIIAWLNEAFVIAMQTLGLQAGYGYASMIDPTTQADSGILPVIAQLAAMLLFFAVGLDRELLRIFAASLATTPPGSFRIEAATAAEVVRHTGAMLSLGARLALPLVALLALIDLALALLGRLNAQLQLLTLAFPVKMLVSLVVLASLAGLVGVLYRQASGSAMAILWRLAAPHP
jgi:flagellar biosynthetic protein FliR